MRNSPAPSVTGRFTTTIQKCNRKSNLQFRIFISVRACQVAPKGAASKRRSRIPRIIYRDGKKKSGQMAKRRKTQRSPRYLRGVKKIQRGLQRKRNNLAIAKQAVPAFFLFMAEYRPQLQKQYPHRKAVQIAKKLGRMWRQQPEEDKEMYKQEAARLRKRNQRSQKQK